MLTLSHPVSHSVPSYSVAPPDALSLRDTVQYVVERYLAHADKGALKSGTLYEAVQHEMEKGLFEAILKFTGGNESRAARILGVSRGTLRQRRALFGDYSTREDEQD
jgi:Fis family transcriptional regulator, factor for inversion stimulation protein